MSGSTVPEPNPRESDHRLRGGPTSHVPNFPINAAVLFTLSRDSYAAPSTLSLSLFFRRSLPLALFRAYLSLTTQKKKKTNPRSSIYFPKNLSIPNSDFLVYLIAFASLRQRRLVLCPVPFPYISNRFPNPAFDVGLSTL